MFAMASASPAHHQITSRIEKMQIINIPEAQTSLSNGIRPTRVPGLLDLQRRVNFAIL